MSAKNAKTVKGLPKPIEAQITKFLASEQEVYVSGKSAGKKKWKKAPIKKLSGFELCLDSEGRPILQYNDGKQRTGLTIKSMEQFGHMKGQMLNNFVKEVDYLTEIARFIFNSDINDSEEVYSI